MISSFLIKLVLLVGGLACIVQVGWPVPDTVLPTRVSVQESRPKSAPSIHRGKRLESTHSHLGPTNLSHGPIDLNLGNLEDFVSLPGIGKVLATRIIEYRNMQGPFETLAQLVAVKGIGSKRLAQLRPFLKLPPKPH